LDKLRVTKRSETPQLPLATPPLARHIKPPEQPTFLQTLSWCA
jgi:hypothetical protein